MNILIIEDEHSSAQRLQNILQNKHKIVAVCASNQDVNNILANNTQIDLILSDIQLGDGLSFQSLKNAPQAIPIIFITAYNQYAIQAFQFNSIQYLLKPVDPLELIEAIQKAQQLNKQHNNNSTTTAIAQILESVKTQNIRYRQRFLIPHRADEYLIIPVTNVSHITIRDGVVKLCTNNGTRHTLNMTLEEIEQQLDPQRFRRVNRQYIINAQAVQKLSTFFLGKMRIHMTIAPEEQIIVSKDKVATIKRWLDF